MNFRRTRFVQGPGMVSHNGELMFSIVNHGKQKNHFQYMAYVDTIKVMIDGDLPIAGRTIYEMGFGTQREAKLFCETFAASTCYSMDGRKQEAMNAVHEAEDARM